MVLIERFSRQMTSRKMTSYNLVARNKRYTFRAYRDHFHIRCSIDHVENTFLPFSELTLQCEWQWTRLSAIRQNHLNVLTIYNNVIAFFCYINRMTLWSKQSVRAKYRQTNFLITQFLIFSSMKQYSNTTIKFIRVLAGSNLWRWREDTYFKSGSCDIYRHSCLHWCRC